MIFFRKLFILFLLFFLVNCGGNEQNVPKEQKSAKPSETPGKSEEKTKTPVVVINKKRYYVEDIINYAYYTLVQIDDSNKNNPEVKNEVIKNFIDHKLLLSKAKDQGINVKSKEIEKVLKDFKSAFGKENLSTYTSRAVLDLDRLKNIIEEQLIIQRYLGEQISRISISEEDVKNYYKDFSEKLDKVTLYHIFHLFTRNEKKANKARGLMRQRHAFSDVAKEYSEGPARENGGDLGYVDISNYPEPFDIVTSMNPGSVSRVVKSEYGYHIFKLEDSKRNVSPDYKDVKSKLYSELFINKQDKLIDNLTKELRADAEIIINDNASFILHDKSAESKDNK